MLGGCKKTRLIHRWGWMWRVMSYGVDWRGGHAACCGVVENGSWGQGLALSLKINGEDRRECGWVGGKGERQTPVGSWRDLCARAPVFTHFQGCSLYKSRPAHPILLYPGSLFSFRWVSGETFR